MVFDFIFKLFSNSLNFVFFLFKFFNLSISFNKLFFSIIYFETLIVNLELSDWNWEIILFFSINSWFCNFIVSFNLFMSSLNFNKWLSSFFFFSFLIFEHFSSFKLYNNLISSLYFFLFSFNSFNFLLFIDFKCKIWEFDFSIISFFDCISWFNFPIKSIFSFNELS